MPLCWLDQHLQPAVTRRWHHQGDQQQSVYRHNLIHSLHYRDYYQTDFCIHPMGHGRFFRKLEPNHFGRLHCWVEFLKGPSIQRFDRHICLAHHTIWLTCF